MALECLNLELQLMEPWAAGGSFATAPTAGPPEVLGTVLRGNRSLLLLPIWSAPGAQFVVGQSAPNPVSLVVPGVPDDAKAYQLRPGGLQPLWAHRVPGGTHVTLDELGLAGPTRS